MDFSPRPRPRLRRGLPWYRRYQLPLSGVLAIACLLVLTLLWRPRPASVPLVPVTPASGAGQIQASAAAPVAATASPLSPAARDASAVPLAGELQQAGGVTAVEEPVLHGLRLTYEPGFSTAEIQSFLDTQPGPLKGVQIQVGDRLMSFAEVLMGRSALYSVNPKVVLALIELQSGLISGNGGQEGLAWALNYRGEGGRMRGIAGQLQWGVRELHRAQRDYPARPELLFADQSRLALPGELGLGGYAIARVLAQTVSAEQLPALLSEQRGSFRAVYRELFGIDPATAPGNWPAPAEPFLARPMERLTPITSFFDHETPFLQPDGGLYSFWGRRETYLSYDGHDGWDYALAPPDPVLAAAAGQVVFAGNSDDGCGIPARAVVIDHDNGYRSLYWHLNTIDVETGQAVARGQRIGMAGATGCVTGPHLHFQVQYLGRDTDPYGWCGSGADPWQIHPAGILSSWLWMDRPSPCAASPAGSILVDADGPGFQRSGEWVSIPVGVGGNALFAVSLPGSAPERPWEPASIDAPALAIWQPQLSQPGRYQVLAYVPYFLNGLEDATRVRYRVRHADGEAEVLVDYASAANDWADLGTYRFDPASHPLVSLSSLANDSGRSIWADALLLVPADQ